MARLGLGIIAATAISAGVYYTQRDNIDPAYENPIEAHEGQSNANASSQRPIESYQKRLDNLLK